MSAVAREAASQAFPQVPIRGVILPGARAAAARAQGGPVAVLATEGTVRSGAYTRTLESLSPGTPVTAVPCPLLVPLVEAGLTEGFEAENAVRLYLHSALTPHDARTVILGCTHYPFLLPTLTRIAGPEVAFIDPAGETVRELACLLEKRELGAEPAGSAPAHTFFATGDPGAFAHGAGAFLGAVAAAPERLWWHEGRLTADGGCTD